MRTTGTITLNLTDCTGNFGYQKEAGATVNIVATITVTVANLTEGTPVKLIAEETVGSVTAGDVLFTGFADDTGIITYSHNDEGTLDITVAARNQGVAIAAIAEDNGTGFTNETDEAHSNATADMTILPATPALNDAYYFAHIEEFSQMKLNISTALTQTGAPTIVWEYWNGAWVSLSGVSDGTAGFETVGESLISWTPPGDWVTTSVTGHTGALFYVRARLSVVGTITTTPVGRRASLDVTRYFPYEASRTISTGTGLADNASWIIDQISIFE